jgi:hypothetical protein
MVCLLWLVFHVLLTFADRLLPSPISTRFLSGIAIVPRSPAYRGHARVFLKDLEAIRPSAIIDIIHSGESFELGQEVKGGMKSMREFPVKSHQPCPWEWVG